MTEHAVVIAGGGPTGLMLAGELALAGVDVVIVERRSSQDLDGCERAVFTPAPSRCSTSVASPNGSSTRVKRIRSWAMPGPSWTSATSPPATTTCSPSGRTTSNRSWPVGSKSSGSRSSAGARWWGSPRTTPASLLRCDDGSLRGEYLVGCDGGRSLIRKTAGIDFPGWDASASYLIAQAEMDEEPVIGMRPEGGGIGPVNREKGGGPYGVVLLEKHVENTSEPTLEYLRETLAAAYGTDFGVHSPNWISRFTDATRQAESYRQGRVLLAGDAAHVHGPQGGQGLNTGVQDAVNLGWKLAQVVNKTSPESLLDTYHAERHPVGARVLQNTMAQVALARIDERSKALRESMLELLSMDQPRIRIAAMISGLDIHYDLGEGHPLLGRRMPDLDLHTADGATRVFALLHDARPVLLNLG